MVLISCGRDNSFRSSGCHQVEQAEIWVPFASDQLKAVNKALELLEQEAATAWLRAVNLQREGNHYTMGDLIKLCQKCINPKDSAAVPPEVKSRSVLFTFHYQFP